MKKILLAIGAASVAAVTTHAEAYTGLAAKLTDFTDSFGAVNTALFGLIPVGIALALVFKGTKKGTRML